ncbi:hypothetical protein [Cognatishimia sp.]|uniref:hypothetical protein n=1 Tax=Cognatishimia sp. TaxID=2211648 RepID=UPI0035165C34|nr:hypothetical protein [Cognatishimia sp.]
MEQKVVTHVLAEQLKDLGFDSERHTGWWHITEVNNKVSKAEWVSSQEYYFKSVRHRGVETKYYHIKTYDCHDLIKYISTLEEDNNYWSLDIFGNGYHKAFDRLGRETYCHRQPQNALAEGIIEILKGDKQGQ